MGPAYIDTKTIVLNNLTNFIKTTFEKRHFFKKTIVLDKKIDIIEKPITNEKIAKLLCKLSDKKIFNYWKYAKINFLTEDVSLKDNSKYKKYNFLSIEVKHESNKIELSCNEQDILMLFFLTVHKIEILKFYQISIENTYENVIDMFLEICKKQRIILITNNTEAELIEIMTIPTIDNTPVKCTFNE